MNKITPKKFEKIDDSTLRVIAEKVDDVDVNILMKNKEIMAGQVQDLENKLNNAKDRLSQIEMLISEATKLGIVPETTKE